MPRKADANNQLLQEAKKPKSASSTKSSSSTMSDGSAEKKPRGWGLAEWRANRVKKPAHLTKAGKAKAYKERLEAARAAYVPTGNPRGRPRKEGSDAKPAKVSSGKPRGRPAKA